MCLFMLIGRHTINQFPIVVIGPNMMEYALEACQREVQIALLFIVNKLH